MSGLTVFSAQMINGITLGVVYALISVGYTLVYSILRLINFAHGEFYMAGAFAALFTVNALIGSQAPIIILIVSALAAAAVGGILGVSVERLAFRRVRRRAGTAATLITSLGVSIVLRNIVFVVFGPQAKLYQSVFPRGAVQIGGVSILYIQLFILAVTVVILTGIILWIKKTNTGIAMRAVAQEPIAASLIGINSDRVVVLAFAVGSALAGVGGWLFGMYYGRAVFYMGLLPGLKAFTACILGGMGSIPGALLGSLLLGLLEVLSGAYISMDYKDAFTLGILIVVLLVRPQGLLGKETYRRV